MTPDAYALSAKSAEWVRRSQAASEVASGGPAPDAGAPRIAWVRTQTLLYAVTPFDGLFQAHVIKWLGIDTTSVTWIAPEVRPVSQDQSCYVYFPNVQVQNWSDAVFFAVQAGTHYGRPLFIVPGHFHLDTLVAGGTPANGDILYRVGGAWARLPIGTAGQTLKVVAPAGTPFPQWV